MDFWIFIQLFICCVTDFMHCSLNDFSQGYTWNYSNWMDTDMFFQFKVLDKRTHQNVHPFTPLQAIKYVEKLKQH